MDTPLLPAWFSLIIPASVNVVSFVSERYFSTVVHAPEGMDTDMAGAVQSANGSHTPPSRSDHSPIASKGPNS